MNVEIPFYMAAVVAIVASLKVITRKNPVHALLYLVVSLLAIAVCFYLMGAPLAAGLEVIVYAGAILVLFVFAVMMFDLANHRDEPPSYVRQPAMWLGPSLLALVLLAELIYLLNAAADTGREMSTVISAKQVGIALYGPYLLAVEIASFLLLAGLIAGYHFAKSDGKGGHL